MESDKVEGGGDATPSRNRRFSKSKLKIPPLNLNYFQRHPEIHVPMSAGCVSAIPIGNVNGPFGLFQFQPSRASEFMNRRYENFKDFTKNTAKSGLSFGEKALFWLNGRVRQLSKKWFTHIFLIIVVALYTFVGAILFVTVEGTHESREKADIEKELNLFMSKVRGLALDKKILMNSELWRKNFKTVMAPYENQLLKSFTHGVTPDNHKTWSFWNSLFYCGTIYTTIGEAEETRAEGHVTVRASQRQTNPWASSMFSCQPIELSRRNLSQSPKRVNAVTAKNLSRDLTNNVITCC